MSNNTLSMVDARSTVRFETAPRLNPVVRLETSKAGFLAAVLSRAFHNDPNFRYVVPDEQTRGAVLPWFFNSAIRASQLYGEISTTETVDGGALWIRPARTLTFGLMLRAG